MNASSAPRFAWLDGLRGIAALIVVLHHALSPFGLQKLWLPHAQLAVDFFFCLSGFVVAAAYQRRCEAGLGAWALMRRRWQRLYPMALLGVLLGGLGLLLRHALDGRTALGIGFNLLLWPDLLAWWHGHGATWPGNVALWSIWIELLLSAGFAIWGWRAGVRALWLAWLLSAVALAVVAQTQGGIRGGHHAEDAWVGLLRGPCPFIAGLLLWHAFRAPAKPTSPWLAAGLLALALLVPTPAQWDVGLHEWLAVLILVPATVACAARAGNGHRLVQTLASLGALSFPLYALHYPVIELGSGLARRWDIHGTLLGVWILLELLVALAIAAASARWIEPRLQCLIATRRATWPQLRSS